MKPRLLGIHIGSMSPSFVLSFPQGAGTHPQEAEPRRGLPVSLDLTIRGLSVHPPLLYYLPPLLVCGNEVKSLKYLMIRDGQGFSSQKTFRKRL